MSMFYELMMRKKTQIMYATIKGSLTENDGVFSGFSDSNYLALQNQFTLSPTTKAEFDFKINISSLTNNNAIFGSITNYGLYVGVNSSGNLELFVGDNSSWIVTQTGTTTLSVSTDYDIKLNINNNIATLYINGNIELTANLGLVSSNTYDIGVGRGITTSDYFRGSIDLNNSYVKVGVKYNLQAVVGYTKVGSPTITDGVVSGFSSSDYLQLGAVPNINQNFEMQCKFTTGNTIENGGIISSNNYYMNGFRITNSKVAFSTYFNGAVKNCIVDTNIATNTTYIAYAKRVGNNINVVLYDENKLILSTNNLSVDDYTISLPAYSYLGYGVRSGTFNGSIDLNNNNTYIKLGNKLWFNGQQA